MKKDKLNEDVITYDLYLKIFVIAIIFVIILLILSYMSMLSYKKFEVDPETKVDTETLNVHVDVFEVQGNRVEISGFAYKDDEELKTINSSFVLIKEDSDEKYILNTSSEKNINVSEKYKKSGLHTRFVKKGLTPGRYHIYVLYKNNGNNLLNTTGVYLDIVK